MWWERSPREQARKAPHIQLPLLVSGSCLTSPQEKSGGVLGVKPRPPGGTEVHRRAWNTCPAYAAPAMHVAGQADTQRATSNCFSYLPVPAWHSHYEFLSDPLAPSATLLASGVVSLKPTMVILKESTHFSPSVSCHQRQYGIQKHLHREELDAEG